MVSRRTFVQGCGVALFRALASPARATALHHDCHAPGPLGPHPAPRSGITAAKVATREQLASRPKVVPVFDSVREIPGVIDGIRCNCGCAATTGFYSLLTCFEGEHAMAMHCPVCQGQAKLAARMHKEGKTLDEIRVAVDAQFGD